MIQKLSQRRNAFAALTQQHLDQIYDLIFQVYGERETSLLILQKVLVTARKRYHFDRLEKYAKLWILRIAVESIQSRYRYFISEQPFGYKTPLFPLSLEEKLCVFLHDRLQLSIEELASVLQIHAGRAGRSLVYGHEKLAQTIHLDVDTKGLPLPTRVALQVAQDTDDETSAHYFQQMSLAKQQVRELPSRNLGDIESPLKAGQVLALIAQPKDWKWSAMSWQSKLAIEFAGFGIAGALVVVALPWILQRVNTNALMDGRFGNVIQIAEKAQIQADPELISADRLIASRDLETTEFNLPKVEDEFSKFEFPSGDSYEVGSAPLAPSRQSAAVYRLIVQSPSPKDMIPAMKELFAQRQVRERELNGQAMPGGVYFDGITTQGDFPTLLKAIQEFKQVGKTATYGDRPQFGSPKDRARVIIWVQQI
jgi:DNA-directed RNA polymerase specialized sigma24 family protein